MSLRLVGATLLLLSSVEAAIIHLPSDVGTGAEKHIGAACMSVMGETQSACSELSFGASNSDCDFAVCYTANLNRDRCKSVVTDGTPENIKFQDDLDKIQKKHDVVCGSGGQGDKGIRNAKFDCKNVAKDGMWDGSKVKFLQTGAGGGLNLIEFARKYPASAQNSALEACLSKALGGTPNDAPDDTPDGELPPVSDELTSRADGSSMSLSEKGSQVTMTGEEAQAKVQKAAAKRVADHKQLVEWAASQNALIASRNSMVLRVRGDQKRARDRNRGELNYDTPSYAMDPK